VAVLAVFVATVTVLGGLLGRTTGAPIVATALVAVLVEPLLRRLRTLVNRLVYGEREDPYAVLSRLGARLEATQDESAVTERLLPDVAAAVAGSLRLPYAALELADGSRVEHGTPTSRLEARSLTYGEHDVGRLVVGIDARGLGRRESRALDDLAGQAAVAAHTVLLARELNRSREALVSAREEERRRLYRDLHDGLGPSLAALALQVETARDLVDDDPGRAAGVLDRALPRLKGVVGDVREVVTGLRPPALDDLGLEGALRELAGRFATVSTAVDFGADPLGGLPAAVEVAAYRIAAEALTNAARHSGAGRVDVRLERRPAALMLRVEDDGRGFEQPGRRGVGLESMQARASELGGTCTITSGPARRGTVVAVCLPTGGVAT
jgi:two-component system, NarL family, sensor kinase